MGKKEVGVKGSTGELLFQYHTSLPAVKRRKIYHKAKPISLKREAATTTAIKDGSPQPRRTPTTRPDLIPNKLLAKDMGQQSRPSPTKSQDKQPQKTHLQSSTQTSQSWYVCIPVSLEKHSPATGLNFQLLSSFIKLV